MEVLTIALETALLGLIAIISLFCAITVFVIPLPQKKTIELLVSYFLLLFLGYVFSVIKYGHFFTKINWSIIILLLGYLSSLFFFFFIQKYLRKNYKINKLNVLVFLPSIFLVLVFIIDLVNPNNKELLKLLQNYYFYIFDILYILVLNLINLNTIYWYKKTVLNTQSSLNHHEYKWVSSIVFAKLFIGIFPVFFIVISHFFNINLPVDYKYIIFDIIIITVLFFILVKTLMNAKNTKPIQIISKKHNFDNTKKQPTDEQLYILKRVLKNFEEHKTYKKSNLNLKQLAHIFNVKPRMLSSTINTCLNQNFYDFINSYRIKEAKKIIQLNEDKKLTIAEVMYQVGYNSKSSFNTAFKKFTGQTPSFFKKIN